MEAGEALYVSSRMVSSPFRSRSIPVVGLPADRQRGGDGIEVDAGREPDGGRGEAVLDPVASERGSRNGDGALRPRQA